MDLKPKAALTLRKSYCSAPVGSASSSTLSSSNEAVALTGASCMEATTVLEACFKSGTRTGVKGSEASRATFWTPRKANEVRCTALGCSARPPPSCWARYASWEAEPDSARACMPLVRIWTSTTRPSSSRKLVWML